MGFVNEVNVKIKYLNDNALCPTYGTEFSCGADLYSATSEDVEILPGETKKFPVGIALEIPDGLVGLVFARSGMATKKGLAPANKVGVIDSDYRGEIIVALHNHSDEPQIVSYGDRIAQIAFMPYFKAVFEDADDLEDSERGTGGFGSTGI